MLIDQIRAELRKLLDERSSKQDDLQKTIATAETRGDANLTADETAKLGELRSALADIDAKAETLRARLAELEDDERRAKAAADLAASLPAATPPPAVGGAQVRSEARTYTAEAEKRGVNFIRDAINMLHDPEAAQRMHRHLAEERVERPWVEQRAVGTAAFAGLTVPTYLTDMVARSRKKGRVLANIANRHTLPPGGMTVELSRITTGSSAAAQASQGDAVSETNMDDTALSIPVATAAGQQTISMQALMRSTGVEGIILDDLARSIDVVIDNALINTATTGLDALTDANVDVAYTDASPTVAELWPKIFDGIQQVQAAVYGGVDAILMHPRRFWWIAASVGTSFPFVNLSNSGPAGQAGSVATTGYGQGPSGYLAGLPVYVDANIVTDGGAGTDEDRIYIVNTDEVHLWEDSVMQLSVEAPSTLQRTISLFTFYAFTNGRYPSAHARIAGTGLVTPTF